jgi:hypothetical protein
MTNHATAPIQNQLCAVFFCGYFSRPVTPSFAICHLPFALAVCYLSSVMRFACQHFFVGGEGPQARKILFQRILNLSSKVGSRDQTELGRASQRSQTQTASDAATDN